MLIRNHTTILKRQKMFNFSIASVALFALFLGSLFLALDRTYAQPETNKDLSAPQLAGNLNKDFVQLKQEDNKILKAEIEKLRKYNEQLELKSKELYLKLEKQEEQIRDKESLDLAFKKANAERVILKQQKQDLLNQINGMLKKARIKEANLYKEQAVVYMKTKFFDLAITAYENALKANPDDALIHYNLSLLYNQVSKNRKKSLEHMKKYLKLSPEAKNKKEAQYIIDMLSADIE